MNSSDSSKVNDFFIGFSILVILMCGLAAYLNFSIHPIMSWINIVCVCINLINLVYNIWIKKFYLMDEFKLHSNRITQSHFGSFQEFKNIIEQYALTPDISIQKKSDLIIIKDKKLNKLATISNIDYEFEGQYFIAENFKEFKKIHAYLSDIEENLSKMYISKKAKDEKNVRYWSKSEEERKILNMTDSEINEYIEDKK